MKQSTSARQPLSGRHFDVAVVGGGINGVAIAREAARAGASVVLVEQHDFAAGTTSRSTRLIHGGLRYLEHGELGLVRESLRERDAMLRDQPHLVRPLRFVLAMPPGAQRSALALRVGLWLYRQLGGVPLLPARRYDFNATEGWAYFDYEDAQCEFPERLVAEWLGEAAAAGAVVRNHTEVLEVVIRNGAARGIRVRDRFTGVEEEITAAKVVNATGPWADRLCAVSNLDAPRLIGGTRGSHIVLRQFSGAPTRALYTEAEDGRPLFAIPWAGQVLVGTTEVADDGDPGAAQASPQELEYLLQAAQKLFPGAGLGWDDVNYAYAGVRPLPYAPGLPHQAISRRSIIHDHADDGAAGFFSIIGGKLTTAASLARECARQLGLRVPKPVPVQVAPPAASGICTIFDQWARQVSGAAGISTASARAIAEWHGRRAMAVARCAASDPRLRLPLCAHTPHVVAEALEAVHHEQACTLADILLRRIPVALGACWTEECSQVAAARIAQALGWTETRYELELEAFETERARAFRNLNGARLPARLECAS